MPSAAEIQCVLPGCHTWQAFCGKNKVDLTSHALTVGEQIYLVDPIRLTKEGLSQLENLTGKISAILLTNGNHERDAAFYRDCYQIPIYADSAAAGEFSFKTEPFSENLLGLKIIPLPGAGLGEIGIYDPANKLLCLGDILINLDSFAFAPLPDKYATNPKEMRKSLQSLTAIEIDTLCFAHGLPITHQVEGRIAALIS